MQQFLGIVAFALRDGDPDADGDIQCIRRAADLDRSRFHTFAQAFGAHGEVIESTAGFLPALERALGAGRPAVIEIRIPKDASTPAATLTQIRDAALKARA